MTVTARDKCLFEKLNQHAVVTTSQIAEIVFSNTALTTVLRRLRKLEDAGYIKRNHGLESNELAWILTADSAKLVSNYTPKHRQSRFTIDHDTKLTTLRLALESTGLVQSWVPEHEIRHKVCQNYGVRRAGEKLIPDGLMSVLWQGAYENISIELELTGKSTSRYKELFRHYKYKESLLGVWYLVPTITLGAQIKTVWSEVLKADSHPYFLWSLYDDVIKNKENALIHLASSTKKLSKLWQTKNLGVSAQEGAHRLSSLINGEEVQKNIVTAG